MLYRVNGGVETIELGLAAPTRDVAHIVRLIGFKLERIAETIDTDASFGFEALGLAIIVTERMEPQQVELVDSDIADSAERHAALVDSLRQRLGSGRVRRLAPVASHVPERAEVRCAATQAPAWPAADAARPRPILFLSHPEPAEVTALVPEGPPRRFSWRGSAHGVAWAQGPERIASEWWQNRAAQPTRDYYLVEDEDGRRFWLYREGLYGRETAAPRWFVHGLFA
jgi:protein ImuB